MEEMITITKYEYGELLRDRKVLIALESTGVENWDGYYFALERIQEEEDD